MVERPQTHSAPLSLSPSKLTLRRGELLDAICGETEFLPARARAMVSSIQRAHSTATVTVRRPDPATGVFWIAEEHTTVVVGADPVVMYRIMSCNTILALIAMVELERGAPSAGLVRLIDESVEPGRDPKHADRWWRLVVDGAAHHRTEVLDRSPQGIWRVDERHGVTALRPTTVRSVIEEMCEALADATTVR